MILYAIAHIQIQIGFGVNMCSTYWVKNPQIKIVLWGGGDEQTVDVIY